MTGLAPLAAPIFGATASGHGDLHAALRSATDAVHQRLHRHPGFAAIQSETIDRARYVALLRRLHGFHQPFEAAAMIAPVRSRRIADDIAALVGKVGRPPPRCPSIPALSGADAVLGALYVVEGAALGGRGLARHLGALLGAETVAGRTFFSGSGTATGAAWRSYLARLDAVRPGSAAGQRVVTAAVAVFAVFETWLRDWDSDND